MEWYQPERLIQSDQNFRNRSLDSFEEIDKKNDFCSYKIANSNDSLDCSGIEKHNDLSPEYRLGYLQKEFLQGIDPKAILDLGCGLGITTGMLAKIFPGAQTFGLEVSSDAVEFARRNYPNANFLNAALSNTTVFDTQFDLILALEFYPFTRTMNVTFQCEILENIINSLADNGVVLIHHRRENQANVEKNLKEIKEAFPNISVKEYVSPNAKVYKFIQNRRLANFVTYLLGKLFKKEAMATTIVLRKK